jgi:hypothetical protein
MFPLREDAPPAVSNASDANGRFALLTTYWDLQEGNKDTTDFANVTNDR